MVNEMLLKDISIFSSFGHFVLWSKTVCTIMEKHFCEIILNLLFKDFSIFSSVGHFVQQIRTICAILVEGIMGNIHVKLFQI